MAVTADSVVVELEAKIDGYMQNMARAHSDFGRKTADMATQLANFSKNGSQSLEQLAVEAEIAGRKIGEALGGASYKSLRNDDIQEYGRQLDDLRAKFNPIFAASKQYEATLDEINRAHQLGAITTQEQAAAIQRLNAQYTAQAQKMNAVPGMLKNMGSETRNAQQQMRNLAFQFQDIGTMLAAGQSPFMLLAQQLPQVTMYGGQLNGVMGALKSTVAGLVSPLGLLTTGFVLAASAAISFFSDTEKSGSTLNDVLDEHRKHIDKIISGYSRAEEAAKNYREEAARLSPREAQIEVETAQKGLRSRRSDELERLRSTLKELQAWAAGQGLKELSSQIGVMASEAEKADPAVGQILEGLKSIKLEGFNVPGLEAFVLGAIDAAENVRSVGSEIKATSEAATYLTDLEHIWARIGDQVNGIDSSKSRKEVQDLIDKFYEGEIGLSDLIKALGDLSAADIDLQSQVAEIIRLGTAADITRQKLEALSGPIGGTNTVAGGKTGRISNLPETVSVVPTARVDPYFDDPIKKTRGGGRSKRENEYQRLTKQIKDRTTALWAETEAQAEVNPLIKDYGYAAEKAKTYQQLLNAAEAAKVKMTPEILAAIEKTADAYATVTSEAKRLAEEQKQIVEMSEFLQEALADSFMELVPAIETGNKALDKFLNTLIEATAQALLLGKGPLAALFGGSGGGLLSLFGFAGGGIAAYGKPMQTYARGGVAKTASIFGEAGPEAAVPLPDGRSIPVDLRTNGASGSQQNVHVTVGVDVDGSGNLMPFVQSVSQSSAEQSTASLARRVPKMVDNRVNVRQTRKTRPL